MGFDLSELDWPASNTNGQSSPKLRKLRYRHAILFELSLGILILAFSSTIFNSILFHKVVHAFDTLKIPEHCSGT